MRTDNFPGATHCVWNQRLKYCYVVVAISEAEFVVVRYLWQSDVQDLAQALELSRQGAVDSLRFTGGDLSAAFKVGIARHPLMKVITNICFFLSYFMV